MIATYSPVQTAPSDFRLRLNDLREMVPGVQSGTVTARVPSMTHGHRRWSDRMPGRLLLALISRFTAFYRGLTRRQPVPVWTITHDGRTTTDLATSARSESSAPTHLIHHHRPTPRAESPRGPLGTAHDETRNPHQCNGARNARRDSRRRPLRRTSG